MSQPIHDFMVGGASGAAGAAAVYPFIYAKNIAQKKRAGMPVTYSLNPAHWYKGVGTLAGSLIPTTGLQVATAQAIRSLSGKEKFSPSEQIGSAAAAGFISSVVVNPAEVVMLHQQNDRRPFIETASKIYREQGLRGFGRGMGHTMAREGTFSALYQGAAEEMDKLMPGGRYVAAGGAALATNGVDADKTLIQGDFSRPRASFKEMFFSRRSLAGLGWRTAMYSAFITIVPEVKKWFGQK